MENHELFAKEEQTLATAERMLSSGGFLCEPERRAYTTLLQEYRKLFRTTRRLMRLSDHNERELAGLAEKQRIAAEHISRKNRELEILSSKLAKYLSPQVYESIFTGRQEVLLPAFREEFEGVDVDDVLRGLQRYARLRPRLKYLWQEDIAALEDLLAEREEEWPAQAPRW